MPIQNLVRIETYNNRVIELLQVGEEYCIDSRIVAPGLGIDHHNFIQTIRTYQTELEHFGQVLFQTEVGYREQGGGNPQKYALLNRNQILFTITLSRNTPEVIAWKMAIIDALDQLEKQVKSLKAPRKQKRLPIPNDQKPAYDPEYQRSEIIRTFSRIGKPLSPSQLCAYLRHFDVPTLCIRCRELVDQGKLMKLKRRTKHSTMGIYQLIEA